ncbi:MAG: DUF4493 domain-containing protein [Alistipes sp.]|nr:DUF4493 domain-containing protein [Alistipes sp.]
MKIVKLTAVTLFAALTMIGCGPEGLDIGNSGEENTTSKGLLSVESLVIDCRIDESDPDVGVLSKKSTRSNVVVDNFECSIIDSENEVVQSFKFSERPTAPIELETGDYLFKIVSGDVPAAAWETPVYGTVKPFKIVRNQTTSLSEIVCTLMQIKVSVSFAPDLLERLGNKTITTVSVGNNSLEYTLTETRAGFFLAPEVSNTISLHIEGTYAADKENFKKIEMNKEVRDVKAGQYSKIHFFIEHADQGNIDVGVTIRDWVTDEVVPCNVADLVTEEEWTESGGNEGGEGPVEPAEDPSIVWDKHDISKREPIVAGLEVDLLVSASKGIKEFLVEIRSGSLTPEELAGTGLCNVLNICYPKQSYDSRNPEVFIDVEEPLRGLGFSVGEDVINKTFVKLSITQFMGVLQAVSGSDLKNHDFIITVTDNAGNTTVKTLMLQTGK